MKIHSEGYANMDCFIGYVYALTGEDDTISNIKYLHNHKGLLTVVWKSGFFWNSSRIKEIFRLAWLSRLCDLSDNIEHYTSGDEPSRIHFEEKWREDWGWE